MPMAEEGVQMFFQPGANCRILPMRGMAFSSNGVKAWSVGVAYVSYDTSLLLFVAWQTWELRRRLMAPRSQGTGCE